MAKVLKLKNGLGIFTISGPSGAGKTSLHQRLTKEHDLNLERVVTCTTRAPRVGEIQGVDYHFLSESEFKEGLERGEFAEFAKVYGNFYGTKRIDIQKPLHEKTNALLSTDVKGALTIKEIYEQDNIAIFIAPASIDELRDRLVLRGDKPTDIERRLSEARMEMDLANKFDYKVVNEDGKIDYALSQMKEIVLYASRKL